MFSALTSPVKRDEIESEEKEEDLNILDVVDDK